MCGCLTHLSFSPGAFLNQTPGHGGSDGKGLEEGAYEVAEAEGNQLLNTEINNNNYL